MYLEIWIQNKWHTVYLFLRWTVSLSRGNNTSNSFVSCVELGDKYRGERGIVAPIDNLITSMISLRLWSFKRGDSDEQQPWIFLRDLAFFVTISVLKDSSWSTGLTKKSLLELVQGLIDSVTLIRSVKQLIIDKTTNYISVSNIILYIIDHDNYFVLLYLCKAAWPMNLLSILLPAVCPPCANKTIAQCNQYWMDCPHYCNQNLSNQPPLPVSPHTTYSQEGLS